MPIKIYNIEKSRFSEEIVGGEGALKFLYETHIGRLALFGIVKRKIFSAICGKWARSNISANIIEKFISDNKIDSREFERTSFNTFNEFFTRALKPSARPLAEPNNLCAISFPSDGRHLAFEDITECGELYIKGESFELEKFLGDKKLAEKFAHGSALISRLSPVDYHRFHAPIGGEIVARKAIKGNLFSVNPIALKRAISIFWRNKRVVNIIESPEFGMVAFIEVGATNVGGIVNSAEIGSRVGRGDELGYFNLGGSCVVTIFEPSAKIEFDPYLAEMSARGIECYARAKSLAGLLVK